LYITAWQEAPEEKSGRLVAAITSNELSTAEKSRMSPEPVILSATQ